MLKKINNCLNEKPDWTFKQILINTLIPYAIGSILSKLF